MTADTAKASRQRELRTWSALGDLGRKPTEYEVVTHKLNHTMREPPLELSPDAHGNVWLKRHRDGMRLSVPDWDAFRDPEQLTYRKYVKNQDDNETYIDGVLREFTEVHRPSHPPTVADFLQTCLTPARYLVHGLQMMSAYLQQLAPSSYIGNCAAFQTADQLRRIQRVAYRTKQLDLTYPARSFGKTERREWEGRREWQGMRKGIERLLIAYDWDDAFVGLNLVVKPLVDEITLRQFAIVARDLDADLDALIADNLFLDARRSCQWSAAFCQFVIAANAGNREHLGALFAKWRPLADDILDTGSQLLSSFSQSRSTDEIAACAAAAWFDFMGKTGLQNPESTNAGS
jgi:toluene monooxygenase system protein E